jgi:hypothetical protein
MMARILKRKDSGSSTWRQKYQEDVLPNLLKKVSQTSTNNDGEWIPDVFTRIVEDCVISV